MRQPLLLARLSLQGGADIRGGPGAIHYGRCSHTPFPNKTVARKWISATRCCTVTRTLLSVEALAQVRRKIGAVGGARVIDWAERYLFPFGWRGAGTTGVGQAIVSALFAVEKRTNMSNL